MKIKVCIARQETADKKQFRFHPAIQIDKELFVYSLGLKSRVTATRVAAEIGVQLEDHVKWWLRDHDLQLVSEIPDVLIDVVS